MTILIRPIADAELAAWIAALQLPFFADGDPERNAALRRPHIDLARCLGAFDGDRICGTFRSLANELTLPGGTTVPASAITAVTVLPTHRRQGLLRRMMAADLDSTVERGEPLAILIASEYPIYGRYGFGRAADHVRLGVDARSARFVRPGGGTVELVDRGVIRELGPALYERFRLGQVGSITRSDFWWDTSLGIVESPWPLPKGPRQVLHRDERGQPQGYLRYHVDEHWNDRLSATTLVVDELLSCTDDAYARLWRYACEVDWVVTVKAEDRSPDEVLPWLLEDARAVQQHHRSDFLWVRILDPVAALGARRYAAPGRVVFDVARRGRIRRRPVRARRRRRRSDLPAHDGGRGRGARYPGARLDLPRRHVAAHAGVGRLGRGGGARCHRARGRHVPVERCAVVLDLVLTPADSDEPAR